MRPGSISEPWTRLVLGLRRQLVRQLAGLALHIQAEAPISRGLYLNTRRRLERGGRRGRVLPKVEKNDLPFLGSLMGSSGVAINRL